VLFNTLGSTVIFLKKYKELMWVAFVIFFEIFLI